MLARWLSCLRKVNWKANAKIAGMVALFAVFMVVVVAGVVSVAAKLAVFSVGDQSQVLLEDHRARVDAELEALRARSAAVDDELARVREAFAALQEEVLRSIDEREEAHDAVDSATTIGDIDAVLKRGVPGVSGGRGR